MGFRKNKKKSGAEPVNPALPPAPLPPLPGMPLPAPNAPPCQIYHRLQNYHLQPSRHCLIYLPRRYFLRQKINQRPNRNPSDEYGDLWAKKSNKPLPQIYGHIDRISSGKRVRYSTDMRTALDIP